MVPLVKVPASTRASTLDFRPILREMTDAAMQVRRTLRSAIRAVLPAEADFTSRQIAEALGLDKTSGWRCVRIATIADVAGILGSLPRAKGWQKILDAIERAGCPATEFAALRAAVDDLLDRIERRGISAATLEVIAAGELDDTARKAVLRRIRQQHFESTLLTVGVSARARLGAMLVAPNESGEAANLAAVTLVEELERHRAGPPWNVHVGLSTWDDDRIELASVEASPFLPARSHPATLGEEIIGEIVDGRWRFDFVDRLPDREGPVRAAFCESMHAVGLLRTSDPDETVTFAMPHGLPVQVAVFDLLLHRAIEPSAVPYAAMYATMDRVASGAGRHDWPETTRLPLESATVELAEAALAEPLADLSAVWMSVLGKGAASIGHDLADFRVHRTMIAHPPVPATIVVRWGLPVEAG